MLTLTKRQARQAWEADKRRDRRGFWAAMAALAGVFLLCLCFRYMAGYSEEKFVPAQNYKNLFLAVKRLFTGGAGAGDTDYRAALAQLKTVSMALVSGAALGISGAVFQTAYRNPMASPNIIGATAGVGLGNVLVVAAWSAAAYEHILLRYEYCYGLTALCVAVTLLLGKLAGDRRENYSVMEMVMVGSIASQAIQVVSLYLMYNLEDEDLLIYERIQLGAYIDTDAVSMGIFFGVMAASILPVLLLRYRMNALGMDRLETAALGVRAAPLRLVGQLCGALMVTCAMIHCGELGMLTMVVPWIVRCSAGSDFRKVCVYSAVCGGILVMVCRVASSLLVVLGETVPVAFLTNLVLAPAFLAILAKQGGGRDEA